ncbi:chloride channel protein [Cellulomonas sp. 73-145]|uniref:chloride channel protein n=1 Tax=Cellulomonas sp. 73-145 TaxID=1895739 RepID=UPI0025C5A4B1|nr:chloride channel protein [Cellulomonas sp. 73-145]
MSAEIDTTTSGGGEQQPGRRLRSWLSSVAPEPPTSGWRRMVLAVVLVGVGAGVAGAVCWLLLHGVQQLALGTVAQGSLGSLDTVAGVPLLRRLLAPAIAGLLCGLAWWWLRRHGGAEPVTTVLRDPDRRLAFARTWFDALLQTVVVGAGASIGREGAPRQGAAAVATWLSERLRLDPTERRLMVGAAAGAGLAAVYNVPLTGAVYVLEVLLVTRRWRAVVAALAVSAIATVTAWPVVGRHPVYPFPTTPVTAGTWVGALVAVPVTALVGVAFARTTSVSRHLTVHRPQLLPVTLTLAGAATGLASWWLPTLPGNGKAVLDAAFVGSLTLLPAALLIAAKPAATASWLWSGAAGGLLTPALATGAATGAVVALLGPHVGLSVSVPQLALIMAVGVLAVTQRAPLFAATFGIELTHPPALLWLVLVLTAVAARALAEAVRRSASARRDRH